MATTTIPQRQNPLLLLGKWKFWVDRELPIIAGVVDVQNVGAENCDYEELGKVTEQLARG